MSFLGVSRSVGVSGVGGLDVFWLVRSLGRSCIGLCVLRLGLLLGVARLVVGTSVGVLGCDGSNVCWLVPVGGLSWAVVIMLGLGLSLGVGRSVVSTSVSWAGWTEVCCTVGWPT